MAVQHHLVRDAFPSDRTEDQCRLGGGGAREEGPIAQRRTTLEPPRLWLRRSPRRRSAVAPVSEADRGRTFDGEDWGIPDCIRRPWRWLVVATPPLPPTAAFTWPDCCFSTEESSPGGTVGALRPPWARRRARGPGARLAFQQSPPPRATLASRVASIEDAPPDVAAAARR